MNWKKMLLIGIAAMLLIGGYFTYKYVSDVRQKAEYINYNTFLEQLASGQVKAITYQEKADRFTYVDDGGKTHNSDNPKIEDFKEQALLAGVEEFKENNYDWLFNVFMSLLSMTMLGMVGFSIIRSTRGIRDVDVEETKPTITFSDVAGMQELKAEFQAVANLAENRRKNKSMASVRMPRGILLEGPPGTGKTYLAKAFAGEVKQEFFACNASQFGNVYAGLGARQIANLFKKAKKAAPSVIFIDELDSIGAVRSGGGSNVERDDTKTLTALLSAMDGFNNDDEVLVIAATNRAEDLDPALVRAGRFDKKFIVTIPDREDRRAILDYHIQGKPLADDVDVDWLVGETVGYVPADIESVINEAALLAIQENSQMITKAMFESAIIQTELKGKHKKTSLLQPEVKKITAYHEAGHAVVSALLCGNTISRVTIIPSTSGVGGYTKSTAEDVELLSIRELKHQMMLLYGGREAERVLMGGDPDGVSLGCSNDIERATGIARRYINYLSLDSENEAPVDYSQFGNAGEAEALSQVKAFMHQTSMETSTFLKSHWTRVERIARALLEKETLYNDDIEVLLEDSV